MSQNIQLGISLICGGATYGLASVAHLNSGVGIALAVAVGGIVLIALASKNSASVEEVATTVKQKVKKEVKKLPSPQKVAQKAQKVVQKVAQKVQKAVKEEPKEEEEPEVPETPDKKKQSKKKKKSSGGAPLSSPVSPSSPQHKPKSTPKQEEDAKDLSKNQLRKLKKKEAEEKQKVEDEKQRAAELARKAAEQKREAAQQKKLQAKARKAAQKGTQTPETKVETKQHVSHEPEEGWEVAPNRSRGRKEVKDFKDSKEPIVIDVKIPPRQHALIVGKMGEGKKKLEDDLDVIITMPKRDSGDNIILIKGLPKDVYMAKKAIEEIATKGYSSVTQPSWITKQAQLQTKGQLALVFGEKGSNLQAISKATKTRLQMPEKGTDNLQISVTGDERHVDHALSLIQELLDQGYTKTTHPDWVQDEVQVGDPAILGAIIGPKGATIQKISKENKVKIDTPKLGDSSQKQDMVFIRGLKKNVAKAKQLILEIVASREPAIEQEIPDPAWQEDVEEVAW